MTDMDAIRKAAAELSRYGEAMALLHTYFDDARARGLPPHHAINNALGRLSGAPREAVDAVGAGPPVWVVFDLAPNSRGPIEVFPVKPQGLRDRYEVRKYVPDPLGD